MNKIIEKSKKYLTLLLVAALAFIAVTNNTDAVTQTIQVGDAEELPAFVGGVQFATKTTTSGGYLYCLEMAKKTTMHTTATLAGERDAGIAAIVMNGYPTKSFTGDYQKDYYITQTAIWWYLDETTGSQTLGEQFKVEGADVYNLRPYIKNLVEVGKAAKANGYKKTTLTVATDNDQLKNEGTNYVSHTINVTTTEDQYTVSLEGATANTKVVGATSGTESTTLNSSEGFIIKVPANEVSSTQLNIKVTVKVKGVVYKAYQYNPGDADMQAVTPGVIEPTEEDVEASINVGLTTSKVSVIKYDSNTNNILSGAVLAIVDEAGEEITSWTSTNNAHVVRNLSAGKYYVIEKEAPTGYVKSDEKVEFTVTGSSDDVTVKFYNTPAEETVINILKIDSESGNALAGAVLVLKDSTGKEVAKWTSDLSSHVITGLAYGTYTLSEESAPAGYKKSDEVMTIVLDDDHISYQIEYANYREVEVPDTATSSLLFTVLGLAIIGSGIGFVLKNGRNEE